MNLHLLVIVYSKKAYADLVSLALVLLANVSVRQLSGKDEVLSRGAAGEFGVTTCYRRAIYSECLFFKLPGQTPPAASLTRRGHRLQCHIMTCDPQATPPGRGTKGGINRKTRALLVCDIFPTSWAFLIFFKISHPLARLVDLTSPARRA